MRSIPQVWRQAYIAGNHNYVVTINMTLADGTTLTIGNDDIWEGGFSIEEGTSDENTFSIGSAIIGKCTVILNNISEKFSGYDFFNAEFNAYLNLVGLSTQNLRIGHYTVDETSYNGSLITLTALNNMWRFDIPFSEINYTFTTYTTARDVVNAMCQYSGIGIILATQQFQGYNFKLSKPEQDLNCREVLQYIAQATCNYCVINDVGNLELRWYDKSIINGITDWDGGTFNTTTTPYSDGCNRDGGQWYWDGETYVWTQGDDADGGYFYDNTSTIGYITNNNSIEVGTDQIVVTGVKVCSSNQDNDKAYDYSWHDGTLEQTYPRYTLVIQDNVFINKSNAQERTLALGDILKNLHLRSFTASSVNDISIEAGDPVAISDHRGNRFYTFVTNVRFQTNNFESFSCGVESVTQNKVVRYSNEIKTLVEAQRNAQDLVSVYDQAVQRMNNIAVNAMGAYEAYEEVADARIYYLSNKPISKNAQGQCVFTANSTVFKLSGDGFFVSTNGGQSFVNGYSGGELVVNVLNAIGINADWIKAGTIDAARIAAGSITGTKIAGSTITGTNIAGSTITGAKIAGTTITADKLSVATLSAIAANMGTITAGSISLNNNTFSVTSAGALTATSGAIGGWTLNGTSGLKHGADAMVTPNRISCGNHGAILVDMRGATSGHDGFLSVEVNDGTDCVRVGYNYVRKYDAAGNATSVEWASSDIRLKKNIEELSNEEAQSFIKKLTPKRFELKSEEGKRYGFIAQDVEAITGDDFNIAYKDCDGTFLHYNDIISPLVKVVQAQQEEIDLLKQEVALLKEKVGV